MRQGWYYGGDTSNRGWYYGRGYERETVAYRNLRISEGSPLTPAEISAINTNIRAIKYGSGYTVASATLNTSNALNYYFLTNPSFDLRAYTGFYLTLTDTGGKTKKVLLGAVGTGETLDSNIYASLNLASGWTTTNATVIDADSFSVTAGGGYVRLNDKFTVGALYKGSFAATSSSGSATLSALGAEPIIASGVSNLYRTAGNIHSRIANSAIATVDITTLDVRKVLTPSATGIWFTPVSEDAGWLPGSATYTAAFTKN